MPPEGGRKEEESIMKQKKSVAQLLIKYTVILLVPVVVVGLLTVFLYLNKLEKNFEALNTKTIEAANIRMDMVLESAPAIDYQLTLNEEVNYFLTTKFKNVQDRVNTLTSIRNTLQQSLVDRDGIAALVVYSRINDVFIGNSTVYEKPYFLEEFFLNSRHTQEELNEILETLKTKPIWLVTNEHLIYCSPLRTSAYTGTNKGLLFVMLQKSTLLSTWKEVFGNLEIDCALLYDGEDILLQTQDFSRDLYQFAIDSSRQQDYLAKQYKSQAVGNFKYLFTVDYYHFSGDVAPMVRSLAIVTLLLLAISFWLARREAKTIRRMYSEVLDQTVSLGDQLNLQVEELNLQRLHNALRGYDHIPPEKQGTYFTNNRIRVLLFRGEGEKGPREQLHALAERYFGEENIELQYLYEKDMGYTCILGYATRENLIRAVNELYYALSETCTSGVHMGLSSEIHKLVDLADACEQAITALHYCTLQQPDGGIIHYSNISDQEKEKIYYPAEKEAQLLRNIRMGMRDKVEEALDRVYQINFKERHLSGGMIRQLLVKMLNTVYDLTNTAYSEDTHEQTSLGWMSRNVLQTKNGNEAFQMLREMMLSICDTCGKQKEGELRRRIISYIGENFRDPDLSLEKMATDFDMSYHHLSRLFNECMQMNFASYLAGLRLEYSTELLKSSQLSVEQVAQQAGFLQSGTFIRVFKKYYGVTPGKYRGDRE